MVTLKGILLLGAILLLAHLFVICVMKMCYDRLHPGREVFIYIKKKRDVEKDVVVKHEKGIVYTQKHGCFTFRDYLKDTITEY